MIKLYWNTTDNKIVYLNGCITSSIDEYMISDSNRIASLQYSSIQNVADRYIEYVKPFNGDNSEYGYIDDIYDECNPWCVFVNFDGSMLVNPMAIALGETPVYTGDTPTRPRDGRISYNFIGWSPEISPITKNVIYVAQYEEVLDYYTIKFVNYDDSLIEECSLNYGDVPQCSIVPTKEPDVQHYYVFSGWEPEIESVTGDATYKAVYEEYLAEYTINFVNYDGATLQSSDVAYGELPAYTGETPTRQRDENYGYVFNRWTPEIETVTGDTTYTAEYDRLYTVTFKNEDGTVLQSKDDYLEGDIPTYTGLTPYKDDGHLFVGWGLIVPVSDNAEYVAQFKIITYTVTFDVMGIGSAPPSQTIEYGGLVTEPEAPTTSARVFNGWYHDAQHQEPWDFETNKIYNNTTIYASWIDNSFELFIVNNGEEVKSIDCTPIATDYIQLRVKSNCNWTINQDVIYMKGPAGLFKYTNTNNAESYYGGQSISSSSVKNPIGVCDFVLYKPNSNENKGDRTLSIVLFPTDNPSETDTVYIYQSGGEQPSEVSFKFSATSATTEYEVEPQIQNADVFVEGMKSWTVTSANHLVKFEKSGSGTYEESVSGGVEGELTLSTIHVRFNEQNLATSKKSEELRCTYTETGTGLQKTVKLIVSQKPRKRESLSCIINLSSGARRFINSYGSCEDGWYITVTLTSQYDTSGTKINVTRIINDMKNSGGNFNITCPVIIDSNISYAISCPDAFINIGSSPITYHANNDIYGHGATPQLFFKPENYISSSYITLGTMLITGE